MITAIFDIPWRCSTPGAEWPGCGWCGGCYSSMPAIFDEARRLREQVAEHTAGHGEAIRRLDVQREEIRDAHREIDRLHEGIDIAVREIDYTTPWETT